MSTSIKNYLLDMVPSGVSWKKKRTFEKSIELKQWSVIWIDLRGSTVTGWTLESSYNKAADEMMKFYGWSLKSDASS